MKKYLQNSFLLKQSVFFAIVCALLIPLCTQTVLADTQGSGTATYTLLEPLPCIPSTTVTCGTAGQLKTTVNLNQYVSYAFNLMIALAAVAAVVMIVAGGFEYMTSIKMGGKAAGLERAQNAVWGLVLVLCTYIILKTVNPQLVNLPATLVPALQINSSNMSSPADLLKNVTDTANNYTVQSQSNVDAAKAGQQQITQLQNNQADLQNQKETLLSQGATENDPEIQDIEAQQQDYQNQISSLNNDVSVNNQAGINTQAVSQFIQNAAGNPGSNDNLSASNIQTMEQNTKSDIETSTASRIAQMQKDGATPEQITAVSNQADASEALTTIASAQAQVNADANLSTLGYTTYKTTGLVANSTMAQVANQQKQSLQNIDNAVNQVTSLPNVDPALVQQVQQAASDAKKIIQNPTYH